LRAVLNGILWILRIGAFWQKFTGTIIFDGPNMEIQQIPISLHSKGIKQGKVFKIGHNRRLEGTDLIVWLKNESEKPLNLEITPFK
jgi:hypothetical protein